MWVKKLGKGRQEWMKACPNNSLQGICKYTIGLIINF